MHKPRSQYQSYTLEGSLSARFAKKHNHYDHTTTTASATHTFSSCTPQNKPVNHTQPQEQTHELTDDQFHLDASIGDNTIRDYVKILNNEDRSFTREDLQLSHSSWSYTSLNDSKEKRPNSLEIIIKPEIEQKLRLQLDQSKPRDSKPDVSHAIRQFVELLKTSEAKGEEAGFEMDKEQEKEISMNSPFSKDTAINPEHSSKQSISKIAKSSFYNQKRPPAFTNMNGALRKHQTEVSNNSRRPENTTQSSKIMASLPTEEGSCKVLKYSLIKPSSTVASPRSYRGEEKGGTNTQYPFVFEKPQTPQILSHRSSCCSKTPQQTFSLKAQTKSKPTTMSMSKNVQAIVSPRANSNAPKTATLKTLGSVQAYDPSKSLKRGSDKLGTMGKKESKALKSTKIDLVEGDNTGKLSQKKKDEKAEEYVQYLDEAFGKLRKTILENKEGFGQNQHLGQALEDLKNHITDTQNLFNHSKFQKI